MIDGHIHLDQYPRESIDRMIDTWQSAGISGVVAVSTNLASAYRTLALKQAYPDFVFAAVGYHPEQPLPAPAELDELCSLIHRERALISAIGEVGLPHYRLTELGEPPLQPYIELLEQFARLAGCLQRPIVLHAVHDKAATALSVLKACGVKHAQFHWLKAPAETVKEILASGYAISVTPEACYRERDRNLAAQVPLSQLLLETDGPWPYQGPFARTETTPLLLQPLARQVAALKGEPVKQIVSRTTENARRLFQLPAAPIAGNGGGENDGYS